MTLQQVSPGREGRAGGCSRGRRTRGRTCSQWASPRTSGRPGRAATAWASPWSWSWSPCASRQACSHGGAHGLTADRGGTVRAAAPAMVSIAAEWAAVSVRSTARPCTSCRAQTVSQRGTKHPFTQYHTPGTHNGCGCSCRKQET